jgi:hypothetical protein
MTSRLALLLGLLSTNFLWASPYLSGLEAQINQRLHQPLFDLSNQQTTDIKQQMIEKHNRIVEETNINQAPNPNCGI